MARLVDVPLKKDAAGSAWFLLGAVQYVIGGLAGAAVGWLHNGTTEPLAGMIAGCALLGYAALRSLTPRGRRLGESDRPDWAGE